MTQRSASVHDSIAPFRVATDTVPEYMRELLNAVHASRPPSADGEPGVPWRLRRGIAVTTTAMAGLPVYPLDTVRRILQVQEQEAEAAAEITRSPRSASSSGSVTSTLSTPRRSMLRFPNERTPGTSESRSFF
mgnify:CR=1 FL=1